MMDYSARTMIHVREGHAVVWRETALEQEISAIMGYVMKRLTSALGSQRQMEPYVMMGSTAMAATHVAGGYALLIQGTRALMMVCTAMEVRAVMKQVISARTAEVHAQDHPYVLKV